MQTLHGYGISSINARNHCVPKLRGLYSTFAPGEVQFSSALLLGAVTSAILYGSLLYDSIIGPGSENFRERLLWVSIGLPLVMYILGTLVEVLIGKIEEK
ncbi:hypothetical protein [Scytonema sp. PCC 10023]|uniref:hypothetical protein n=1 Tax=Scytonema sp. PCC 10023 TaxID=1680591 RepID=UPI0039C6DC8E